MIIRPSFKKALQISLLSGLLCACSIPETKPLQRWEHSADGAYAADISADGQLSVVSGIGNGINVWRFDQSTPLYHWSQSGDDNNLVVAVHISADNTHVVTADREAFALWSLENGEPIGFWRIDESSIRDIAVTNGGRGILVGRASGKVMYFEPQSGRRIEFLGHQERINSVDISPNGNYALTGGNDYVAYLWDTRSGQIIHTFTHASRVTKVALDDEGRYAFTSDSMQKSQIWDVQSGAPLSHLKYIERQIIFTDAVFSKDGKYLLTGSPARRANLWNVADGTQVKEWRVAPRADTSPPTAVVYAVGFSPKQQVLTLSSGGWAALWAME